MGPKRACCDLWKSMCMVYFPEEFYTALTSVQMFKLLGWFSVWCQGASFHSPFRCFRKLHTGPHSGWSRFCRHVSGGGFPFLLPLSSIDSLQRFWRAFYPLTRWYLVAVVICISPVLSDVDFSLWDIFFKGCELNLPLERLLCFEFYFHEPPRTFLQSRCFLLTAPQAFWI